MKATKALVWKPLSSTDNVLRWDADGVTVTVRSGYKGDNDLWTTHVHGIVLQEDVDEPLRSETPYLARLAAEPVVKAILDAKPVDINFKSDQAIANSLHKIIRGGYNPYEAFQWATENDKNGDYAIMLTEPERAREVIDEAYAEIVSGGDVNRDEAEGRTPGTSIRDKIFGGLLNPSSKLKRRLMR